MVNPRPNLFIVGSMKCATSSLATYLNQHPDVFMAMRPKEPSFFVDRDQLREVYPAMERLGFWRGEEYYLKLFESAGSAKVVGEASANYARLPRVTGVAERIASFNPDSRIIYLMRDPIERTISHYWYMVVNYGEGRGILDAIRADGDYRDTSYYAMQIRSYLDIFGADRVKALTTEALRNDAETVLRDLFQWLGVAADVPISDLDRKENVRPSVAQTPRGLGLLHRVRYSKVADSLGRYVPPAFRNFLRNLAEKKVDPKNVSTEAVEAYLRPIQLEQTVELSELLNRKFPEWRTLYQTNNPATKAS